MPPSTTWNPVHGQLRCPSGLGPGTSTVHGVHQAPTSLPTVIPLPPVCRWHQHLRCWFVPFHCQRDLGTWFNPGEQLSRGPWNAAEHIQDTIPTPTETQCTCRLCCPVLQQPYTAIAASHVPLPNVQASQQSQRTKRRSTKSSINRTRSTRTG